MPAAIKLSRLKLSITDALDHQIDALPALRQFTTYTPEHSVARTLLEGPLNIGPYQTFMAGSSIPVQLLTDDYQSRQTCMSTTVV